MTVVLTCNCKMLYVMCWIRPTYEISRKTHAFDSKREMRVGEKFPTGEYLGPDMRMSYSDETLGREHQTLFQV